MRLTVDGVEIEVSDAVGAVLREMLVRSGRRTDSVTQADLSRARFGAVVFRWNGGDPAHPPALITVEHLVERF